MSDFEKYQNLQTQMRQLIRKGKLNCQIFTDCWNDSEEIKRRWGGYPQIPENYEDAEQMECEESNMGGTR